MGFFNSDWPICKTLFNLIKKKLTHLFIGRSKLDEFCLKRLGNHSAHPFIQVGPTIFWSLFYRVISVLLATNHSLYFMQLQAKFTSQTCYEHYTKNEVFH